MSKELINLCENCDFDNKFKEFMSAVERYYNSLANEEKQGNEKQLTMFEWIMENTNIDEFSYLSEKERFLYGFGFLSSELKNY